jgi:hypothetical protein
LLFDFGGKGKLNICINQMVDVKFFTKTKIGYPRNYS